MGIRQCATPGSVGTACRAEAPRCDTGLECDTPIGGASRCVRRVARGMACDPTRVTTVCATEGDDCDADDGLDTGQCVAPGAAPDSTCRGTEPRCEGSLVCSNLSRYRPTCRQLAAVGDVCDVGAVRVACPTGTRCVPARAMVGGVLRATCTAPEMETEPNEHTVVGRTPIERSMLSSGSLSMTDREDCQPVRLVAGASLYLEVNPAGPILSLFNAAGTELGRWTGESAFGGTPLSGLARVLPSEHPMLRAMAAGDYSVCVRARAPSTTPVVYQLAIGVIGPSP